MNDNELEQLFAAKRTVEANRRRQEELAGIIDASAAPKSRPLWPLWATSAAAGIAILLMTMPSLFNNRETEPLLVAQVPEITTEIQKEPEGTTEIIEARNTQIVLGHQSNRSYHDTQDMLDEPEIPVAEEHIPVVEEPAPQPEPVSVEPEPAQAAPRIHRRTSTHLGKTGDRRIGEPEKYDFRQMLANVLGNEENVTTINMKTFELS